MLKTKKQREKNESEESNNEKIITYNQLNGGEK